MSALQILKSLDGAGRLPCRHKGLHGHAGQAAALAIDDQGAHRGLPRRDAGAPEVSRHLVRDAGQRDAGHAPQTWQPCGHLNTRRERALVIGARHHQARPAAEGRPHDRDQPLPRLQHRQIDLALLDERHHEAIGPSHEDWHLDAGRLGHLPLPQHERQRQRARLEPKAPGEICRGEAVFLRRRVWHDDSCRHRVGDAVGVGVFYHPLRAAEESGHVQRPRHRLHRGALRL